MQESTTSTVAFPCTSAKDKMTEILRDGAQQMLATAIEAEVADGIDRHGLQQLRGQLVAGKWKLKVADVAGRDLGKLNHWALKLLRDA